MEPINIDTMTREQALVIIRQICESFQGNFNDHRAIQRALEIISKKEE